MQLLPLLSHAANPRRVITVGAAGFEGPLDTSDISALRVPQPQLPGLSQYAADAQPVPSWSWAAMNSINPDEDVDVSFPPDWMDPEESGARHLYLLTSAMYSDAAKVGNVEAWGNLFAGTNGEAGSGVYAVGPDGESIARETVRTLAGLRAAGVGDRLWEHTQREFARVAGLGV
ncbi:hypothetical protein BDW74DRAFT_176343 [Aspergillus multicolor]|uniref:uncharacterized protein n=1 Tax=Aspergillus multicolor TaxID=41759 RepID=UPI003CCD24C2